MTATLPEQWLTTPQRITILVGLIWLASVAHGVCGVATVAAEKSAVTGIVSRAIPRISFTREIRAELAELDTAAAYPRLKDKFACWYWSYDTMRSIEQAKENVYKNLNDLWSVRSAAKQCNWYESLILLKKLTTRQYESGFQTDSALVKRFCERESDKFFAGSWRQYLTIDSTIRQLAGTGSQDQAVRLCLGSGTGQSNWAFKAFNDHLSDQLEQQNKLLTQLQLNGFKDSAKFLYWLPITSIGAAVFAWQGVRSRLRKYGG